LIAPVSGRQVAALAVLFSCGAGVSPGGAGTANLVVENDRPAKTDRHFTHGTQLTWTSDTGAVPEALRTLGAHLPGLATPPERASYIVGQTMFTPKDIGASRPIRDDRPYAGWLYGGLRLTSEQPGARQRLELNLGVVGPPSMADETQTLVHKAIDVQVPNGWEHQLKTEPGVVAIYERGWRAIASAPGSVLQMAAMPQVSAAVGNVFTLGALGGRLAIGQNLDANWGPPRIFPGLRGSGHDGTAEELHWSLFVGVQGRVVARNIFIDGNTFRDSPSVRRNPLVGDIQAGLTISYGRARAAFTWIGRSREFQGQGENDQFASMTVSVRF
jgi:hypothetical protein